MVDGIDGQWNNSVHPGAALPAKNTTRGLTFFLSSDVIAFRAKYRCKLYGYDDQCEENHESHMDDSKQVKGLALRVE